MLGNYARILLTISDVGIRMDTKWFRLNYDVWSILKRFSVIRVRCLVLFCSVGFVYAAEDTVAMPFIMYVNMYVVRLAGGGTVRIDNKHVAQFSLRALYL